MKTIREAYGEALAELGAQFDFYVLDADLSKATRTDIFAKKYPDRFFNMGIAECNMYGYSAGIASCGTAVFASTFASFSAGRAFDQIRNSIAYPFCNVKVASTHGGIQAGADGGSHQCLEDLALMRAVANMTILCPGDELETKACVRAALEYKGPVYLRLARSGVAAIYKSADEACVEIGKGKVVKKGNDVCIIAVGIMVHEAIKAAELLEQKGINAAVIDMVSIKPLDEALVLEYAKQTGCIVTCEDHNIIGGLGGAVCEYVASAYPCVVERVGVQDEFGCSGSEQDLAEKFGLNASAIANAALKAIGRC